jgi:hypothetical protein
VVVDGKTNGQEGLTIDYKIAGELPPGGSQPQEPQTPETVNQRAGGAGSAPFSASVVRKNDLDANLSVLGMIESSNSVVVEIPQKYWKEVTEKFNAGQALPVEAYDRAQNKKFGHGFLAEMNKTSEAPEFRCRLIPEGDNTMIPGLFVNIRMRLETASDAQEPPSQNGESHPDWLQVQPLENWIADLHNADSKGQKMAKLALSDLGTNTLPAILKVLNDSTEPSPEADTLRLNFAEAIKFTGPGVKSALPAFTALLKSGQQEKAYSGARALAFSTLAAPEAFSILTNALTDTSAGVRDAASHGLGWCFSFQTSAFAEPALPLLVRNLKDSVNYVRRDTAGTLAQFIRYHCERGLPEPDFLIPPLIDLLRDKDAYVRQNAIQAFSNSCFREKLRPWLPSIQKIEQDSGSDSNVRQWARSVLESLK